jgi:hypothetical protein
MLCQPRGVRRHTPLKRLRHLGGRGRKAVGMKFLASFQHSLKAQRMARGCCRLIGNSKKWMQELVPSSRIEAAYTFPEGKAA